MPSNVNTHRGSLIITFQHIRRSFYCGDVLPPTAKLNVLQCYSTESSRKNGGTREILQNCLSIKIRTQAETYITEEVCLDDVHQI